MEYQNIRSNKSQENRVSLLAEKFERLVQKRHTRELGYDKECSSPNRRVADQICMLEEGQRLKLTNNNSKFQTDVVKYLVKNRLNPNLKNNFQKTALHLAAEESRLDICQLLVSNGATVDARDSENCTPLHYAARLDALAICQFLVSNGALVDALDSDNLSPIDYAKNSNAMIAARYLEECVLWWRFGLKSQKTALHRAAEENRLDICQLLVSNGATVDARDSKNCTPLHYAARRGALAICQFLVSNGALVDALDSDNLSPIDYAKNSNATSVANYLEECVLWWYFGSH